MSAEAVTFTCSEETGADLGTVELDRMAARIDIVNAVTDLTVDKVVLKNAVIAGNITGEAMPSGDIFEDAACEEELSGDPESPAVLSLYTYDNLLTDDAHLPSVEITYTFAGEQSVKEFTLMEGELPAALVRGTLYSIHLVEEGAELDYSVEGWTAGVSAEEYFSMQDALNSKLAINYFAATNAHSFDFENRTVISLRPMLTHLILKTEQLYSARPITLRKVARMMLHGSGTGTRHLPESSRVMTDRMYYLAINSGDVRMFATAKTNAKYNVRLVKVNE